jgi:hypothetical protein
MQPFNGSNQAFSLAQLPCIRRKRKMQGFSSIIPAMSRLLQLAAELFLLIASSLAPGDIINLILTSGAAYRLARGLLFRDVVFGRQYRLTTFMAAAEGGWISGDDLQCISRLTLLDTRHTEYQPEACEAFVNIVLPRMRGLRYIELAPHHRYSCGWIHSYVLADLPANVRVSAKLGGECFPDA